MTRKGFTRKAEVIKKIEEVDQESGRSLSHVLVPRRIEYESSIQLCNYSGAHEERDVNCAITHVIYLFT